MKKVFISVLVILTLLSTIVFAQSVSPGSADSTEKEKNEFLLTDEVYVKSIVRVCKPNATLNLYIVEDKTEWNDGDDLVDVRGLPQQITTNIEGNLPLTKIWSNLSAGKYDIILDCIDNGKYNFLEPVDDFSRTGFTVSAPAGTGKIEKGEKDPGNHSWQYDAEVPVLLNEMIQLSLRVSIEDIILENITVKSSGVSNASVDKIEIYLDKNGNSKKDAEDTKIGESPYADDAVVALVYTLPENTTTNIIVAYIMKVEAKGNLSLSVLYLEGKGKNSNEIIKFSGTPINSGTKTILTAKSCLGILTLSFPSSVEPSSNIIATMGNLTGCQGKTIKLQPNPCTSLLDVVTCSCVSAASGCNCNFTAPSKDKTYWACIDKNNDTDFIDYGESVFSELLVKGKVKEEVKENITTEATPTPEVIELKKEGPAGITTNTFFLVMEITLILILFVLLLILVSLKKGRVQKLNKGT